MAIRQGQATSVFDGTVTGAGVLERRETLEADTVLVSLWVRSLPAGSLTVRVYTYTTTGEETEVLAFPVVSAPTVDLLLRKAALAMGNLRIEVTHTGTCTFQLVAKGLATGEASVKILGAESLRVTQVDVTTTPVLLVPASLEDRSGILVKHWGTVGDLYLGESAAASALSVGFPLAPRDALAIDLAAGVALYGRASAGTIDVRLVEGGG